MESHVTSVTHVIQLAVAPVFLLTAISTLISALNVRLGRIVDRQRVLRDLKSVVASVDTTLPRNRELALLSRRIHLSYLAIVAAVLAGLLICLVVALAFIGVLMEADLAKTLAALFIAAMVSLIGSLSLFLREIYMAVSTRHRFEFPQEQAADASGKP